MARIVRVFLDGPSFPARAPAADQVVVHVTDLTGGVPVFHQIEGAQDDGQGRYADYLVDSGDLSRLQPAVAGAQNGAVRGSRTLTRVASLAASERARRNAL